MMRPGGILVTHNKLYTGMEAPAVVFIAEGRSGNEAGTRSGRLRAVSRFVYITPSFNMKQDILEQHYNIVNWEDNSC